MTLSAKEMEPLAAALDKAAATATPMNMISLNRDAISVEDAYAIQRVVIGHRLDRGANHSGMKMGLTSRAKMEQVGVHEPIFGHLTSDMLLESGASISRAAHCHPRAEPEIAFVLSRDLSGPVSAAEALMAVGGVCAAIEIIDSRYRNFKFTLPDVIADNASSSRYVLGPTLKRPQDLDLGNLGMVLEHNGVASQFGSSGAIYDHPANSLATLANLLAEQGSFLKAGQVVLAGAATAAIHVHPGDHVTARVDGLDSVSFFVTD
jgi:2-oxo-3-hexenedioate decarboxylase